MKPCVILIDGMNVARRGEVAKAIVKRFKAEEVESYFCGSDAPAHLYVHMMRDALEGRKSVVIENGWRAEALMEVMGERTHIGKQFRRMLDRIALGVNAQIAYCTADTRTYAANWTSFRPDVEYGTMAPLIERMHQAWESLPAEGLKLTRIHTNSGFDEDIELLMDRARLLSGGNSGPGIGAWNPGNVVLLIGDRHGPSIQPYQVEFNLAFCDMAKAGSSYWLCSQLEEFKIQERHLYWINAFDKTGAPTDPEFLHRLRPIAILSMGDSAERWCTQYGVPHEQFTHPQYHKRFHFRQPYPLAQRLVELVSKLP